MDDDAGSRRSARGLFPKNSSEDLGEWTFPGHLWQWDGPPWQWGPINRMGADNDYVWRDVTGLEDETCKAMQAGGINFTIMISVVD